MTMLKDREAAGSQDWGTKRERVRKGIHAKGLPWGVVERRMERWIRRIEGQDLQACLEPGDGLVLGMVRLLSQLEVCNRVCAGTVFGFLSVG